MNHSTWCSTVALLLCVGACSDGEEATSPAAGPLVVAEWQHGSLSFIDRDALAAGATTRSEIVTRTIDLSAYPPAPWDVRLTPNKKTAVVSSSSGFFATSILDSLADTTVRRESGRLLVIDLESEAITELDAGQTPISVAITPDGKRALVNNFGTFQTTDSSLVVVDLERNEVIDNVAFNDSYAEEIAIDERGEVGIVSIGIASSVRTFAVADPRNTLSNEVALLGGDSGGVAFFPGTQIAFVIQNPDFLAVLLGGSNATPDNGYTVVDVSSPSQPVVLEDVRSDDGALGYPVMPAPKRRSLLVPVTLDGRLVLREYKLEDNRAVLVDTFDVAPGAALLSAVGLAYDGDHTVYMAWPRERALLMVDLDARTSRVIPWLEGVAGPTEVAL